MASRYVDTGMTAHQFRARSVKDIVRLDGEAFIRCAYLTLLGRPADPPGLAFYIDRMAAGKSKVSILKQISRSPEGLARGVTLPGLQNAIRRAMLKRAPVVGPVYNWLIGGSQTLRLPPPSA